MLPWAYRYLLMVVVVGVAFALLTDPDLWRSDPSSASSPGARQVRPVVAAEPPPRVVEEYPQESSGDDAWQEDEWIPDEWQIEEWQPEEWQPDAWDQSRSAPFEMIIPAGPHGHFMVVAAVNGTPLPFVVDTGATDVVLSPAHAARIGFRVEDLRFTRRYRTANGEVAGAPVTLRELRLGQFSAYDVPASVNGAPLPVSLLGTSFLRGLRGYEVDNGRLILRW